MKKLSLLAVLFAALLIILFVGRTDSQTPLTANDLGQIQMPPQTVLGNTLPVTGPLNAVPFSQFTGAINATIPTILPPVVNGDCLKFASPNSIADAGAPCGSGGGGGGGTVFSVGASVPTGLSVSGSPITSSGTLVFGWNGTIPNAQIPSPSSTSLGGVLSASGIANQFMTGINTSGVPTFGTPTGTVSTTGSPASGNCAQFTGPTTITSVSGACSTGGSGTVTSVAATVPTGLAISGSPITTTGTLGITWSGTIPNAQIPTPTAVTLGGIESVTCPAGQFVNIISTLGVPTCTAAGGGNVSTSGAITSGDCAQWNSATTLVSTSAPCTTPPGGSNNQVQFNNGGAFGGLTNTQLTADINTFTSTLSGAVPASGGGTTTFLRADGTFQTPAGSGNVSTSGTITSGDCAQWNSATTLISTAGPCGPGGTINQVQTNNGSGGFSGITNTQLTSLVNLFSATLSGAIPASGGGTANFMRADGTWAAPPATAPGGANNQVQINFGGVFGGITNTQLTADINAFTPSLSGAVPSGGSSTTFLRGDGTWQTPAGAGNVSSSGTITSGNCAQWNSATTIISTGAPCGSGSGGGSNLGYVSIATYGALGDGTCHALSSVYGSLAAAQAVYPFVSDLTQCIDWAATQQAINVAYTTLSGTNQSATVYCPVGNYVLSNPIFVDAPNNTGGSYANWNASTTYGLNANVTYNGIPWVSLGSGNVGATPTSSAFQPADTNIIGTDNAFPFHPIQISNASPAVFTITGTAAFANQPLIFSPQQYANPATGTTPVLPAGLNPNQVYYVVGSSIGANTFQVSATPGGAAINTTSAGVGTFFVSSLVWQVAPVTPSSGFSNRVSFVGDDGLPSSSGCRFTAAGGMWNTGLVYLGPHNGVFVKNITLIGPQQGGGVYRCNRLGNSWGWVQQSNGGGSSRALYENIGASSFYVDHEVGTYVLSDSNTWTKANFGDSCLAMNFQFTQQFIDDVIDSNIGGSTTGIRANVQSGVHVIGGNHSTSSGIATAFAVTGATESGIGNTIFLTATVTSPDQYLNAAMCSYAAGYQYNNGGSQMGSPQPFGNSCGYNVFTAVTPHFGVVPFFVGNFNPFTKAITLVVPPSWNGIYQNTCCGATLTADLNAVTTIYAAEVVTPWYGQIQVDTNHIENDGVPTTIICQCAAFGSGRAAELKNVLLDSEIGLGTLVCCGQTPSNAFLAQFYAQQTTPYINASNGSVIIDSLVGGANQGSVLGAGGVSGATNAQDRALIAIGSGPYLEGRHTAGGFQGVISPLFDFLVGGTGTKNILNLANNAGQLSNGYYALGGNLSAWGGGIWDNPSFFLSWASVTRDPATNAFNNQAEAWRAGGYGMVPSWGVRPAPWAHACITPAQVTTLGALPTITHTSALYDILPVTAGGSGYNVGDTITLAGGTFTTAAIVQVKTVSGTAVTGVVIQNRGNYSVQPTSFTQGSTSGGGTGATFTPITSNGSNWLVSYSITYPFMWGGQLYVECDYKGAAAIHSHQQNGTGYSYFQNLTTTNVPNLAWHMDGSSPFVYMNAEALELMFEGLVLSLTPTGGPSMCTSSGAYVAMVLEVHPTLGYVKTINAAQDGTPFLPGFGAGNQCTGTTIGQAAVSLVQPY